MDEELIQLKEEMQTMLKERQTRRENRPPYCPPITRFAKAELVGKLVRVGSGLGFAIPRDIMNGMNLKRGILLKMRFELFPADAAKLHEEDELPQEPPKVQS